MPTVQERTHRIRAARATVVFVAALTLLMFAGFAKLYTQTQEIQQTQRTLAAQQQQTCVSRQQSRAETDTRILVPLRASLEYFAHLILASAKKSSSTNPVKVAETAAADRFARRYLAYAAAVKPYPALTCQGGNT